MGYDDMIKDIEQAVNQAVTLYIQRNRLMKMEGKPIMSDIVDAVHLGALNAFSLNKPTSRLKLAKMLGMNRNTLLKMERKFNTEKRTARFYEETNLAGCQIKYKDRW